MPHVCGKQLSDGCTHGDRERELTGTWCTPEVDVAIDEGYIVSNTVVINIIIFHTTYTSSVTFFL